MSDLPPITPADDAESPPSPSPPPTLPSVEPLLADPDATRDALLTAAMAIAAVEGWDAVTVAAAARDAGIPLARARQAAPIRAALLMQLGLRADQAALDARVPDAPPRDALFDMLMARIDVLQTHRAGVLAVLSYLPRDPALAAALAIGTRRSMRWLLAASGLEITGGRGALRTAGLSAVWLWMLRAWRDDLSADLSKTMATLDDALRRAQDAEAWLRPGTRRSGDAPEPPVDTLDTITPAAPAA